jgi:site-specific recombinase XerC
VAVLPDWFDEQRWREFLERRKVIKSPMTEVVQKRAIAKLETLSQEGQEPNEVLIQSIVNGCEGLYPFFSGRDLNNLSPADIRTYDEKQSVGIGTGTINKEVGLLSAAIIGRARYWAQHCLDNRWVFCREDGSRIQAVKRRFTTACRRAGIEGFHIHDMRHTCAAWLVTAGVPLTEVRDLPGHSSVKMSERYAHLVPENVRAAVTLLKGTESR